MKGLAVLLLTASVPLLPAPVGGATIYYYKDADGNYSFTDIPLSKEYKPFAYFKDLDKVDKKHIHELVHTYGKAYGVDERLIRAVIKVESGYEVKAVSRTGAQGLMQIMPKTGQDLGLKRPFHPRDNIEAGVRYLRMMYDKFRRVDLALAAYNAGPGAVEKHGGIPPYQETRDYVTKVLSLYDRYKLQ